MPAIALTIGYYASSNANSGGRHIHNKIERQCLDSHDENGQMHVEQPAFPLDPSQFAAALRTGHGRALQHINAYGPAGLEDKIVEACVSCPTYDAQCEADKAPWLYSIIERAKLNANVLQALESIMLPLAMNYWDLNHRSAILKEFAAAGSIDARRLLYLSLVRLSDCSDVIAAYKIVALDGVDGLIFVAQQFGRWLRDDPDFSVEDLTSFSDDKTGIDGSALAALERAAVVDRDVAAYLAELRKRQVIRSSSSRRSDPNTWTGAQIVAYVNRNPSGRCLWLMQWGKNTASHERETVFTALLASDASEHVERLLRCFTGTGVPRFDPRLLRWITHPDKTVQWVAVKALAPIKHAELRRAAMQLIAGGDMANGVALLVNNFEPDDFALCSMSFERLADPDESHRLVRELLDLCEAYPNAETLDCLLYVYELSPCSNCRKRAVTALIDTNIAPSWVKTEALFDADPDTRALVDTNRMAL